MSEIDSLLAKLVGAETKETTPDDEFFAKVAHIEENKNTEANMGELRELLDSMSLEELTKLAGDLAVEDETETKAEAKEEVKTETTEKVAAEEDVDAILKGMSKEDLISLVYELGGETEEKVASEEGEDKELIEALSQVTGLEVYNLMKEMSGEKVASMDDKELEEALKSITGLELVDYLAEEQEKTASDESPENAAAFEAGQIFGRGTAVGLMNTLWEMNEDVEKTAEETQKQELVAALEAYLEKDAGARTEAIKALATKGLSKAKSMGKSVGTYVKAPVSAKKIESMGVQSRGIRKEQLKSILAKAGLGVGVTGAGAGAYKVGKK